MASNYPASLDVLLNPEADDLLDSLTVPHAEQHADVNNAIMAIQAELGTAPSGPAPTVRARLEGVENLAASQITIATEQAAIATAAAEDAQSIAAAVANDAETIAEEAAAAAVVTATSTATSAATTATSAAQTAQDWAIKTSGAVSGSEYSSKYHAQQASTSATAAAASAVDASNSAAAAATALDSFDDRYLGAKTSAPTLDNDGNALVTGALYYQSTGTTEQRGMYVYDGSGWLKASAASVASIVTYEYIATAGQTAFTGNDLNGLALSFSPGLLQVFLNGVLLAPGDDYTTSGSTITLPIGAVAGDILLVVAFASFTVANTYTISQADSTFATKAELATAGFSPFLLMGA